MVWEWQRAKSDATLAASPAERWKTALNWDETEDGRTALSNLSCTMVQLWAASYHQQNASRGNLRHKSIPIDWPKANTLCEIFWLRRRPWKYLHDLP